MVRLTWQWLCLEIRVIKWYYWLIAVTLFCVVYLLSKKKLSSKIALVSGALATYAFLIIVSTVINRGFSSETYNLVPFRTLWELLVNGKKGGIPEAFLNMVLFFPFGFLNAIVVHSLYKNTTLLFRSILTIIPGTLLSISIETAQLSVHRGLCETDDVIHNTLGTIMGYGCWLLTIKMCNIIIRNKKKRSE